MKPYRLTRRARAGLKEIAGWTIDNFGSAQAESYRDLLIDRCAGLASGELPRGRSCDVLLRDPKRAPGLLYTRVGEHYIIYREAADLLIVLDFVHRRRNLNAVVPALVKIAT